MVIELSRGNPGALMTKMPSDRMRQCSERQLRALKMPTANSPSLAEALVDGDVAS
jgi:hypothetical protein